MTAVNILVGAILALSIICTILLLRLWKRGVLARGYLIAPLAVVVNYAVWAVVSLLYRNIVAGGLPSLFVSTWGAHVQIFALAVLMFILWTIGRHNGH